MRPRACFGNAASLLKSCCCCGCGVLTTAVKSFQGKTLKGTKGNKLQKVDWPETPSPPSNDVRKQMSD